MSAYRNYIKVAFTTHQGIGVDAKIRTTDTQKKGVIKGWTQKDSDSLKDGRHGKHSERYFELLNAFTEEFQAKHS